MFVPVIRSMTGDHHQEADIHDEQSVH